MSGAAVDAREWTVLSLIGWSAEYFSSKSIDSPRLTAELLLCQVLNCPRIELYTNFDKVLAPPELAHFRTLVKRRLAHEPVQYIAGSTEFMGLRFTVDTRTLIPRPETEVLVEQVIEHADPAQAGRLRILDIGTGSGNIAVSLANSLPLAEVTGIDVSSEALDVARGNVHQHRVGERVKLALLDILKGHAGLPEGHFDYVVSNPPYIPAAEIASLAPEIREYEPLVALKADGDGLVFFRAVADAGRALLKKGGWSFVEVGAGQHDRVAAIFSGAGYSGVAHVRDYGGIERVVRARAGGTVEPRE